MARFDFSYTDVVSVFDGLRMQWVGMQGKSTHSAISQGALQPRRFSLCIMQEMHQKGLENLRAASKATRTLCATWMDTLGPEIIVINRWAL